MRSSGAPHLLPGPGQPEDTVFLCCAVPCTLLCQVNMFAVCVCGVCVCGGGTHLLNGSGFSVFTFGLNSSFNMLLVVLQLLQTCK